jgi:FixJ family two-component response regulator
MTDHSIPSHSEISSELGALTSREREVMGLVVEGHSSRSIAKRLLISASTVEVHREHLMRKTGARNVATLVRLSMAHGGNKDGGEFNLSSRFKRGSLTSRECEVMHLVVEGHSSKSIGRVLRISPRTVEVHRARIMLKTGARSVAALVRMTTLGPRDNEPSAHAETRQ